MPRPGARWRTAAELAAHHDQLLFHAAFPDSLAIHRTASRALDRIGAAVRSLSDDQRDQLADSGVAGTSTSHTFIYEVARWLARRGERIAFDWRSKKDADRLDTLIRFVLATSEEDRFDSGEIATSEWLAEVGARTGGGAAWLLADAPDASRSSEGRAWRAAYEAADVPLRWSLEHSRFSTSRNRVPVRVTVRSGFRKPPREVVAHIETPLRGIRRACGAASRRWHDASIAALAARTREVFPTIHANHEEIILAPLGEGATLCLLGLPPADRSALEANYGYVIFANGIPVGYGGFTTLGAQANTGANVFESFRGSEFAFLYVQSLRAVRTYLGVTRFVVNPYQIGDENEEAIASGAYWFYDRLGFRPQDRQAAALAKRERDAIALDRGYRSTPRTLRALARGDLVLSLGGAEEHGLVSERVLIAGGRLATRALAAVPAGERARWIDERAHELLHRCTGARRALTPDERRGAVHLVPILVPLLPRIARWSRGDRRALWRLVALKGAPQEAGFAKAAGRHAALWRALNIIHS